MQADVRGFNYNQHRDNDSGANRSCADSLDERRRTEPLPAVLFARFTVDLDGNRLSGMAWGEAIDLTKHDAALEPKGATCTSLQVCQGQSGCWRAQWIIDA